MSESLQLWWWFTVVTMPFSTMLMIVIAREIGGEGGQDLRDVAILNLVLFYCGGLGHHPNELFWAAAGAAVYAGNAAYRRRGPLQVVSAFGFAVCWALCWLWGPHSLVVSSVVLSVFINVLAGAVKSPTAEWTNHNGVPPMTSPEWYTKRQAYYRKYPEETEEAYQLRRKELLRKRREHLALERKALGRARTTFYE